MSDEPFNILEWGAPTPHDLDANDQPPSAVLGARPAFAYIGKALTIAEFANLLPFYDFGPHPPNRIVLHHTAIPTFSQWIAGEAGLTDERIKAKRVRQLDGIRNYYRDSLGWSCGPHLFVDDRSIYLFSPMNAPGIHARAGNGTAQSFSIGIEVVGAYTHTPWPASIASNVARAVALLHQWLRNFELLDGRGEGRISGHRDWGKPACPGAAITPDYYLPLFRQARAALEPVSHPDPFREWGPIGKPEGQRQDFAIPRTWLLNKKLGKCVKAEDYPAPSLALAVFEKGFIWYNAEKRTAHVEMF